MVLIVNQYSQYLSNLKKWAKVMLTFSIRVEVTEYIYSITEFT